VFYTPVETWGGGAELQNENQNYSSGNEKSMPFFGIKPNYIVLTKCLNYIWVFRAIRTRCKQIKE